MLGDLLPVTKLRTSPGVLLLHIFNSADTLGLGDGKGMETESVAETLKTECPSLTIEAALGSLLLVSNQSVP